MSFEFFPCRPGKWSGRYRVIPGKQSVFHVRYDNVVDILRTDKRGGLVYDRYKYLAVMTDVIYDMAERINAVKEHCVGQAGGSFVINEFGQVICPVADGSWNRYLVGECEGAISFHNPDGGTFTLDDDDGMTAGNDWKLPYVGTPYNLSRNDNVYIPLRDGCDTECKYPAEQDHQLIGKLRSVRGTSGGFRFLVNPHGIVLTKIEDSPFEWHPKYVGRINYACWFDKEET